MRSFEYGSNKGGDENLNSIFNEKKAKIFRQQFLFISFFTILIASVVLYIIWRLAYTTFDGYVHLDIEKVRALDDIYITKIHHRVGDLVETGDTLYTYVFTKAFLQQNDAASGSSMINEYKQLWLKKEEYGQQGRIMRVKINELRKQIESEQKDIIYGLTDNANKMALEAQERILLEQIEENKKWIEKYNELIADEEYNLRRVGILTQGSRVADVHTLEELENLAGLKKYITATQASVILNVLLPGGSVVFKGEEIMDLQHIDVMSSNFSIIAYVPTEKANTLGINQQVDIVFGRKLTLKANVVMVGVRAEELPGGFRNSFSSSSRTLVSYLQFMPGQQIPIWVISEGVPVKVRVNNFKRGSEGSHVHYTMPYRERNINKKITEYQDFDMDYSDRQNKLIHKTSKQR